MQKKTLETSKKILRYFGKISLAIISASLMVPTAIAVDPLEASSSVLASEGGKTALNEALKVARSKPALSGAAAVVCLACIPVAGAAPATSLCIACGILIAKVLG
jgi:hypothetical protein